MNDFMGTYNEPFHSLIIKFNKDQEGEFTDSLDNINIYLAFHSSYYEMISKIVIGIIIFVCAFYFLVLQGVISLFGIKQFFKSLLLNLLFLITTSSLFAAVLFMLSDKINTSSISPEEIFAIPLGLVTLLCLASMWYLKRLKKYSNKALSVWIFVAFLFPIIITGIYLYSIHIVEYLGYGYELLPGYKEKVIVLYLVLFIVLFFSFLPWIRSVIYKLYSLPK